MKVRKCDSGGVAAGNSGDWDRCRSLLGDLSANVGWLSRTPFALGPARGRAGTPLPADQNDAASPTRRPAEGAAHLGVSRSPKTGVDAPGYNQTSLAEAGEILATDTVSSVDSRRWKCICAYDGTSFEGWQSQVGGRAIQDVIEAALAPLVGGPTRIHASGRTDAGVHAHGQVFHFDAAWKHGADKLRAALRSKLPPSIQIKSIRAVAPDFHARFSATGKIYHYHLFLGEPDPFTRPYVWSIERSLDLEAMKAAAALLQGKQDFRAFSALNGPPKEDTVRDLRRFDLTTHGQGVQIHAEGDGFMYKMVRSLVGALVAVGDRKLSLEQLADLLRSGKRIPLISTAPPQGLFLVEVLYP